MSTLDVWFRHRSSLLLLLVWPILRWWLDPPAAAIPLAIPGAVLVAAGVGLRLAAARRIGRGARVHRAGASAGLRTSGPYAFSRNPLYLAAALVLTGLGLLAGGGARALLLLPATAGTYLPVVLHEERVLRSRLGAEFAAYAAAVPRWLGRPRRGLPPDAAARVPWREVLRREPLLLPGLWTAAGVLLLESAGVLPLRQVLAPMASLLPISPAATCGLAFLAAALVNSASIERKRCRRARARPPAARGGVVPC